MNKPTVIEKGVFPEFDKEKMTVSGVGWWKLRLQPWKWKYIKKHGIFFRRIT